MFKKFQSMKYNNFHNYFNDYFQDFDQSLKKIDVNQIKKITKLLEKSYKTASTIYVCGNGGSAAIANHFECDHKKILNEISQRKNSIAIHIRIYSKFQKENVSRNRGIIQYLKIYIFQKLDQSIQI